MNKSKSPGRWADRLDVHNTNINEAAGHAGAGAEQCICRRVGCVSSLRCMTVRVSSRSLIRRYQLCPARGVRHSSARPRVCLPAPQCPRCILWVAEAAHGRCEDPADRRAAQDRSSGRWSASDSIPAIVQLFRRRLCIGQSAAGIESDADQRPKTDPARRGDQRGPRIGHQLPPLPKGCTSGIAAPASRLGPAPTSA